MGDFIYQKPIQPQQIVGGLADAAPLPTKQNPDYDLPGYIAKYGEPDQSKGQHLTDEFKLPNHITFSTGSKYSNQEQIGGEWKQGGNDRWVFIPSAHNLKHNSPEQLAEYFSKRERVGTYVQLPDGRIVQGTIK